MNTNARWFRAALCGAVLAAVAHRQFAGADETQAPPVPQRNKIRDIPVDRLLLSGVVYIGKSPFASIRDTGTGFSEWYAVQNIAFGYVVKEITTNYVVLVNRTTGEEPRIELSTASTIDGKPGPQPYTKAWINSRANPMLHSFRELPGMYDNWSKFTPEEKEQIQDFYRKHGWKLVRAVTVGDTSDFEWTNIYSDDRTAAIKANREKFVQTLTPEQLVLWKQTRTFQRISPIEPGKWSDEQKQYIASSERAKAEFKATLTPGQKTEYDGIMDFTKADWK